MRDCRYRIEYAAMRLTVFLLRLLPIDIATAVTAATFRMLAPWTRLHQRALANLKSAFPQADAAERGRIASAMWGNTGRVVAETVLLDRILSDPGRITVTGGEALSKRLATPGPNIAVTLHLGNWELVARAYAICGGTLMAVYRPFRNPYIDRWMLLQRKCLYPAGLLAKGGSHDDRRAGHATARGLLMQARQGASLGFVCDQAEWRSDFTVPFFGHRAKFSPVPAMIARHVDAPIWAAKCQRIGQGSRFQIDISEIVVNRTNDRQRDVQLATTDMARQFELWIRGTPDQWMWWQRRSIADG